MGDERRHEITKYHIEHHVTLDLGDKSSIEPLLTGFVGALNKFGDAYNRRTDAMFREAELQKTVEQLTKRLTAQNKALAAATNQQKER